MAWRDCWGTSPCRNARELSEAFFAGKPRKRGKFEVVVYDTYVEYKAYGRGIAMRLLEDKIPDMMTDLLLHGNEPPCRKFEVTWGGMQFEKDIARHLRGLHVTGVECAQNETRYQDQRFAELCGKPVEGDKWYTLEEAAASTLQHPPPRKQRIVVQRLYGNVNPTLPLPGFA